jgi:hypothetical protein
LRFTQKNKGEIGVETSFVKLVEDHDIAAGQFGIADKPACENSLGHDMQSCVSASAVLESDLKADFTAEVPLLLMRDPGCGGTGSSAAWLKHNGMASRSDDFVIGDQGGGDAARFASPGFGNHYD